jgi:hypothetical protein
MDTADWLFVGALAIVSIIYLPRIFNKQLVGSEDKFISELQYHGHPLTASQQQGLQQIAHSSGKYY